MTKSYDEPAAHGANKFENSGEGNMNNALGSGSIWDVHSGAVVHSVAHNSGNIHNYYQHISSPQHQLCQWLDSCGDTRAWRTNFDDYILHERIIQDQTQTWLFSELKYQRWYSVASPSTNTASPNVLWLYGDAGFGKSVLCAHAIRQQLKLGTNNTAVAINYQFYKMNNESETPWTAYLTLARMLVKQRFPRLDDKVPDEVMAIVSNHPSQDELRRLIKILIREFKIVYIFIDGLDEMVDAVEKTRWSDAKHFLQFILNLAVDPRCPEDDFDTVVKVWISSQWRREIHHAILSHIPGISTVSASRPSSNITPLVQIPLTQESNQSDISAMFRRELEASQSYGLARDDGVNFINRVLEILQPAVKGNFLWARLMLDSIANAASTGQVIEAFETVPDNFRTYLGNRIKAQLDRHPESRRIDAAHILSCLMYAQRPILVDELCEAVCAYRIAEPGQNMRIEDKPFEGKIEEICAPLVRVDQRLRKGKKVSVCTLYHSAVRVFLRDTPDILTPAPQGILGPGETDKYILSPRVLAHACMRYLWQERYKKPLLCPPATQERGFLTSCHEQQDINKHAFLAYCAKYWARHHDYLDSFSEKLCEEIKDFIYSPHFHTTLQVQSLFVQSRFRFMISTGHEEDGAHLVRAFPSYFTEQWPAGKDVQKQYNEAIGDFGYYLDRDCGTRGSLTGQIDRCVWGMLGSKNEFHRVSRRRQGFKLEPKQDQTKQYTEDQAQCLYHDNVGMEAEKMTLFSVVSRLTGEDTLEIKVEQFTVKPGHRPKPKDGQFSPISVLEKKLELYQRPLKHHVPGRPRAVAVSSDGRVLRVGSEVFVPDGGLLRRVQFEGLPEKESMDFFEEISNRGPWVAMGRRRKISLADLSEKIEDPKAEATVQGSGDEDSPSSDRSSTYSSSSSDSEEETDDAQRTDSEDNGTAFPMQAAGQEQPPQVKNQPTMKNDTAESDLESAKHKSVCCSARESCSPGSTSIQSDEIDQDDDFWNDWLSDDDDLQIDDMHDDSISEELNTVPVPDSLDDIFDDVAEADDEKNSESDILSHLSEFQSDDAWSDSNDESDEDPVGVIFHDGRRSRPSPPSKVAEGTKNKETHLCELLVLNTDQTAAASVDPSKGQSNTDDETAANDARPSLRVFRFARKATGLLFSSPPAIHPTRNLLVWPLGGDEVLFAHFSPAEKTFFTILLKAGGHVKMCHVSVQVRFSPCGQYLHIACLDGAVRNKNIDATGQLIGGISDLWLRVSTYRLSRRKPARSVPRLIYRMSCPLWPADTSSESSTGDGHMDTTPLPWTLTWDWSDSEGGAHVYACQSSPQLHVLRAPLFADVEAREWSLDRAENKDDGDTVPVFRNTEPVFLPRSAGSRRVHFFPRHPGGSSSTTEGKTRSDKKSKGKQGGKGASGGKDPDNGKQDVGDSKKDDDPYVATVVVSSEDADNKPEDAHTLAESRSQRPGDEFGYRGRAQVAHLTRTQLGDWTRLRYSEADKSGQSDRGGPTRMETWRGQLLSKYEKFDKTDDCDIVPYIR